MLLQTRTVNITMAVCHNFSCFRLFTVEGSLREGWRGDRDRSVGARRKIERSFDQQEGTDQEGTGDSVQSGYPEEVEEGLHAGILTRSQVDELQLYSQCSDRDGRWTEDVC